MNKQSVQPIEDIDSKDSHEKTITEKVAESLAEIFYEQIMSKKNKGKKL